MQSCLPFGSPVTFLLTGKGGWLFLSGKEKGIGCHYLEREMGLPLLQQIEWYYTAKYAGQSASSFVTDANSFPTAEVPEA